MKSLRLATMLFILVITAANASPNPDELKSFRVLVPDYSKTCGGSSPAMSPNGQSIAFYSRENSYGFGDTYVLSGFLDDIHTNQYDCTSIPAKVEYHPSAVRSNACTDQFHPRDIDWSPDATKLAFVGADGGLYLAQTGVKSPHKRQEEKTRLIAGPDNFESVRSPRWSPNGKLIAYVKANAAECSSVFVVDVESGVETRLADDATDPQFVWEQPWSRDSKFVVYCAGKGKLTFGVSVSNKKQTAEEVDTDATNSIAILAVDGSKRRVIRNKGSNASPSWSPNGETIAYVSSFVGNVKIINNQYLVYFTMSIWLSDIYGQNRKVMADTTTIQKKKAEDLMLFLQNLLAEPFELQYGSKLTAKQLAQLRAGKMSLVDMLGIAGALTRKKHGINLKSFDLQNGANKTKTEQVYTEAMAFYLQGLQEKQSELMPIVLDTAKMNLFPVWSTDGKRVAFLHGLPDDGNSQLMVHNLATRKNQVLLDHASIQSVTWSKNGKLLVAEARRLMSRQENGLETTSQPGYPEVWLLEPK